MEDIAEDNSKIVPKLTIKMDGSATEFYVDKSPRSEQKIPKITLKTSTDHAIIIRHNQLNQLPKITIKTKNVESSVETAMHGSPNKLKARQINDPVNEERVPKIMISRDKTVDLLEKVESKLLQKSVAEVETIEILSSSSNCSSDVKIADSGVEAETIDVDEDEENGIEIDSDKVEEKTEAIVIVEDNKIQIDPENEVDELPMDLPKVRRRGRPRKQTFEGGDNEKKSDDKLRIFPVNNDNDSSQKSEEQPVAATRKYFHVFSGKHNLKPSFQHLHRNSIGHTVAEEEGEVAVGVGLQSPPESEPVDLSIARISKE